MGVDGGMASHHNAHTKPEGDKQCRFSVCARKAGHLGAGSRRNCARSGVDGQGTKLLHGRSTELRVHGASKKDVRQRLGRVHAGYTVDWRTIVAAPLQPVDYAR